MSGSTIGGVVGGIIGFYVGGPAGAQMGWMIGAGIGSIVDPQQIQGRQWNNQTMQGSQDGLARAVVFGTGTVVGNLLDSEPKPRKGTRKESAGKGGAEIKHDTAKLTYAIEICDSSELRGTKVNGVIAVWEDERLVYDVRPGTQLSPADSAKWKANKRFFYGEETQAPPPELEAIHGVGNVPAYRGTCGMVVWDEDLMVDINDNPRGRMPTYRFLVSVCEVVEEVISYERVEWDMATETDPEAGDVVDVVIGGTAYAIQYQGSVNSPAGEVTADTFVSSGDWYWETTTGWYVNSGSLINHYGNAGIIRQSDGAHAGVMRQITSGAAPAGATGPLLAGPIELDADWIPSSSGVGVSARVRNRLTFEDGAANWSIALDDGPWQSIVTAAGSFAPFAMSRGTRDDGAIEQKRVFIYSVPDDFLYAPPDGAIALGAAKAGFPGYTLLPGATELPDSPGYYVDGDGNVVGPSIGEGQMCGLALDVVVRKLHDLGAPQLVDADVDFTALESDTVRGYVVQDASLTVADACDPLRRVFTFDLPSYDLKIRAVKRGGPIAWTVDQDDLVAGENASDSSTRGQDVEYPKKLHVGYVDPVLDYKLTTQISERYSTSINVVGEDRLDTLLTLSADEGAQAAHKLHKILWTELEDTRGFTLPLEYLKAAPADLFSYQGRRYRVEQMRIEGMRIVLENAAYDRASAYVSNATGVQGQTPPAPGSGLRGPTVSALMNLPVINDSYDRAGFWWAASGLLEGWAGALLQVSRDGVTFTDGPSVTASATMGVLTEALPVASRYGQDPTNALKVKLTPTSGVLDTLAYEALIAGDNAAAILYPGGTAEIIQWQTATETAPREYTLTGLLRGRQNTAIALHAEGAQFVVLDDAIRFVALDPTDLGQTFNLRPASLGTDPTANATQTITLTTIESLREWQPYNVTVTPSYVDPDGVGYCVEWIGRGRLGSSRAPMHSQWFDGYEVTFTANGQTYQARTTEQALCVGYAELSGALGAFGWPTVTVRALSKLVNYEDDFGSPPAPPVTPPPPATSNSGTPASTTPGPNGGYADDAPYPIPAPTVFGTDVVDGDFSSPAQLAKWRKQDGSPLDARWTLQDGRLNADGSDLMAAYGYAWRYSLPYMPMPRYDVTVTATIKVDPWAKVRLGVAWGTSTQGDAPTYVDTSPAAVYPDEVTISHTFRHAPTLPGVTGAGVYVVPTFMPVIWFEGESGPYHAEVDDVQMTITPVSVPTTAESLDHLDFDAGTTGWTFLPDPTGTNPYLPSTTVSGGELTVTPTSTNGLFRYAICDDPITLADTVGKYVKLTAEVWCNDTTVYSGVTKGGVMMGICVKSPGGEYTVVAQVQPQRGDWTPREWWQRVFAVSPGYTVHAFAMLRSMDVGKSAKVRNITVHVTDNVID